MGSFEWIIYDIAVIWLIVGTVISSYKKGFSKIIISVCGYFAACIIAALFSNMLAPVVYDIAVKDSLTENMNQAVKKYSISDDIQKYISDMTYGLDISTANIEKTINSGSAETLDADMYNLIIRHSAGAVSSYDEVAEGMAEGLNESMKTLFKGAVPEAMTKGIVNYSAENREEVFELIKIFVSEESNEISEYIEEKYIRQQAVTLVSIFIFILLFFIFMFLVKMLENFLIESGKISSGGRFDSVAGALVGVVESMAYIFILSVIVKFSLVLLDDMPMLLNEKTVQDSKLFSIVYNFDILG